jgi:hypothetical protein
MDRTTMNNIKKIGLQDVSITYESGEYKGENYTGKYLICKNPVCTCSVIEFVFTRSGQSGEDIAILERYRFGIDVTKRELSKEGRDEITSLDLNFATAFIKDLNDDDWKSLEGLFHGYKTFITENTTLEEIDAEFPMKDIEESGSMVGYYDIFPYARQIFIEVENEKYCVDDQYCVATKCHCKEIALTLIPLRENINVDADACPVIFYNYEHRTWSMDNTAKETTALADALVGELLKQGLHHTFREHHKKLRTLYKEYKKKQLSALHNNSRVELNHTPERIIQGKLGRNDPCPCGRGKKYKKCCSGKL